MSSKADPNAKDPFTDESGFRYTAWLGLSFEEKRIAEGKGNWINEWPGGESHKKESLKKLAEQHKESTEKFKKSPHHEAARDVFGNAISRLKELKIDSAMFLGMASLTGQPQRVNVSRTAYGNIPMTELIAFESWVEILRTMDYTIPNDRIYVQDPIFNALDRAFLIEERGYTVLESPESEKFLSDTTFLYTAAGEFVNRSCMGVSKPSDLWISDDLTGLDEDENVVDFRNYPLRARLPRLSPDAQKEQAKSYLETHEKVSFLGMRINLLHPKSGIELPRTLDHALVRCMFYKPDPKDG